MNPANEKIPLIIEDEIQPMHGSQASSRVDECRRLVADRYVMENYISASDLDDNKFIKQGVDPHATHSEYFWTVNEYGEVEATARIIKRPVDDHEWKFPMQREFALHDAYEEFVNDYCTMYPENIIEISGLAEKKSANPYASLDMYRRIWQHAKRSRYNVCLISADERLDKKLSMLFGSAMSRAGDSQYMMGSQTVPSVILPDDCARAMSEMYQHINLSEGGKAAENYRQVINYLRDGLESQYFNDDEKNHLAGIGVHID